MRTTPILVVAALIAALTEAASAQQSGWEGLVEDALRRHGSPPGSAEAPPPLAAPATEQPALPPGAPPPAAPSTDTAPAFPPAPESGPAAGPPGLQAAPPAPVPPAAPALPTGPALPQQAAPAAPPRLETLAPETVNAATYREHAEQDRGASALILKAQVLLDRANSSPGVIDGIYGDNVAKAIAAYETVLGLPVDGRLDPEV